MVGGMQTPEQPDFMCEKMVDKVRKLPDYIAINKPIPGKMRFKYGIFLKKSDTKSNSCNREEFRNKPVKYIGK
jgi:hypothetical protein